MKKRLFTLLLVCLMLCSLLPAAALAEDEAQIADKGARFVSEGYEMATTGEKADNDQLFARFVKREMGKNGAKWVAKAGAGEGLPTALYNFYKAILPEIHEVAIGQRDSAVFDHDLTELGDGEPLILPVDGFSDVLREQMILLYCALKADLPFDMYWHDVTSGFGWGYSRSLSDDGTQYEITSLRFLLCVDKDYRADDSDSFTVNTAIGQRVETAANNARAIVSQNAGKSDYEKLRAYNKYICDAVEYDYDAVDELDAGVIDHGDPWQLIWAFDDDSTTNIVCEGYSKAFQHLCDLTSFTNKTIQSIIVTGDAGGAHMWNLVRMEDGKRYLMDVTWSDGSSGNDDYFLIGADGGAYPSYKFYSGWRTFDSHTQALYGESKLTIADQDYVPGAVSIEILSQPQDVTVDKGETATFTVKAKGEGIVYQWYGKGRDGQAWMLLDGETADTLTLVGSAENNGSQYYCLLSNEDGEVQTDVVTLTVDVNPPIVTTQPQDVTVYLGKEATFTVEATGKNITYQWYGKAANAEVWTLLEGKTANTLTVKGTEENDGEQFYCLLKNKNGETKSAVATLTVKLPQPPTIVTQPKDAKAKSGAKAKFTVKTKEKDVTFQWYEKAPGSEEWEALNAKGGAKDTLTVTASGANNGYQYRCLVKNAAGGQVYSNAATLTVTLQPPVIKTQPKDANVKSGAKAKLSVKATGKNIAYTWYERENAESEWKAVAGGNKNTLQVTASKANDGHQFYCHLENADGQADSKVVTLTVKTEAPTIKTQPKSVTVKSGKKAKLSVKATGKNLKYQWFERANGDAEWAEVAGGNKSSLQITATKAKDGHQFYCHVSNADGAVDSAVATLTVTPEAPRFTTQPKDAKVKIGAKARFKVKATPKNVTYQWYYRENETAEWKLIDGATSATYEIVAAEGNIGWQFRCRAWNDDGEAWSKVATLLQK